MAMTNRKFCRPIDEGKDLEYAPVVLAPNPAPPTETEYNAAGWYRNAILPPTPPEGKMVDTTNYIVANNEVVAEYTYKDLPPKVRTFSKFRLLLVLTQEGLWDAFEAWLKEQMVNGVNAYTAFSIANDLTDENPLFNALIAQAQTDLGVSDEQVASILAAAEV